jgi:hypothetical protein
MDNGMSARTVNKKISAVAFVITMAHITLQPTLKQPTKLIFLGPMILKKVIGK